jgi:hypothetical protein
MFLSINYKGKVWTNHERESAKVRALEQKETYILPVRFDEPEIPGIRKTIGYINGNTNTADEVSQLILKKLGFNIEIEELIAYLINWLGDYKITQIGIELNFVCEEEEFEASIPIRLLLEMYRLAMIDQMFLIPAIIPN